MAARSGPARPAPPRGERALALGLMAPALLVAAVFAFYPIVNSCWLSLHRLVLGLPGLGQPFVGLDNYRRLWGDPAAWDSLAVTLAFVAWSTGLEVLIGLGMALVLNRAFRGRGLTRAAVLVPWAIPTVVSSQMWRFIMNDRYGLLNLVWHGQDLGSYQAWLAQPGWALAARVAADVWKTSSFAALLILAGLQTIPDELYEAARLDGAGAWQRFWRITLPLVKPAIFLALVFRTMDAFRVFDLVFVMTQGGPGGSTEVLQFFGYKKIFAEGFMGYGSTISVLVFATVFLVSLIYLRLLWPRLAGRD